MIPASVQKPPLLEDRACFKKSLPRKCLQSRTMLRRLWTSLDGGAAHAGEGLNFPGRSTLAPDTTLGPPPRQHCPRLQTFARPRFLEASSVPLQLWLGVFCFCYVLFWLG